MLAAPVQARVDEVEFGTAHGFFDAPFLLDLETDTEAATIRFTTDSSVPTLTNGQIFQRGIIINRTSAWVPFNRTGDFSRS